MKARTLVLSTCAALVCVLCLPGTLSPCGPISRVAVFVSSHPESLPTYLDGNLGVLQPGYSTQELLIAWRVLSNQPLTNNEKQALLNLTPVQPVGRWGTGTQVWGEALNGIPWADRHSLYLNTERQLKDYQFFINCNDDAFVTAAATLRDRISRFGRDSAEVKEWYKAQRLVFANCEEGALIPEPAPNTLPALLRADRAYQIAAANFYATRYDTAAEQFANIARDESSPWRDYGLFLSARAYIRKGTVGPQLPEGAVDEAEALASLQRAEKILQQVIADPSLSCVHDSAQRLLMFIALHLHRQQQIEMLAGKLSKPSNDPQFGQQVIDYLRTIPNLRAANDEMADWIFDVQGGKEARQESVQRWKSEPKSTPWLLAALMAANGSLPETPQLIAAAMQVPPGSPAYTTAQYHAARLRYEGGQLAFVRQQIDAFLAAKPKDLPQSAINAFAILRTQSAADLDDFIKFAVVHPVSVGYEYGTGDEPFDGGACIPESKCPQLMVSDHAADMLNRLPIAMLVRVAEQTDAPFLLRRGAALVAWQRAALLDDFATADRAATSIAALSATDARDLAGYRGATTRDEKRFTSALIMLHWPGATPEFSSSVLRDEPMRELDNFRRNWWCQQLSSFDQKRRVDDRSSQVDLFPKFLTSAERSAVDAELKKLQDLETAPNEIGKRIIPWASAHSGDPRAPEALHLVVRATRYGCTDQQTTKYSKEAFDLLHKRYPNSEWTKKTPYYFGS